MVDGTSKRVGVAQLKIPATWSANFLNTKATWVQTFLWIFLCWSDKYSIIFAVFLIFSRIGTTIWLEIHQTDITYHKFIIIKLI